MKKTPAPLSPHGCVALLATASLTLIAAANPPEDCEISPCYWHFGDADNTIQITGLDELTARANADVQFGMVMQGDPLLCVQYNSVGPFVVSNHGSSPATACQDRFYWGEFHFNETDLCDRDRDPSTGGEGYAEAMGIYRLWSHARPYQIAINFDSVAKKDIQFEAHGTLTTTATTAYSGIAGGAGSTEIDEDSYISVVMRFVIEPTTMPVRLKLHATYLSSNTQEGADVCPYQGSNGETLYLGSWEHASTLWGGCGVWHPASQTWVPGLDKYVCRDLDPSTDDCGIGAKAVVLGTDNPVFDRFTDDPVDIANLPGYGPGEYDLVYWVHSSSYLAGSTTSTSDESCSDATGSIDNHVFQAWLELKDVSIRGDFNSDGRVNIADFSAFLIQYGAGVGGHAVIDPPRPYQADLNRDGKVNIADFSIFLVEFGAVVDCSAPRFKPF